jgi:hypothetical protein
MLIPYSPPADHGSVSIALPIRVLEAVFRTPLRGLSAIARVGGLAVLLQPLAVAGSPESPSSRPINIDAVLPEVRDNVFNVYALVTQPVGGAAWIATARIGLHEDDPEWRRLWSAALSKARSSISYDVSAETKTSADLMKGYADEALRAALSEDDISQLFSFFRSPEGRKYLEFQGELDGIVDYAGDQVLKEMALGHQLRRATASTLPKADLERRRAVIDLSRSASMQRLADQLLASSDRLADFGPAPWDAVLVQLTAPVETGVDPLLVQYQSALDRDAASIDQFSAFNQSAPYRRALTAVRQAATRWLKSPERSRLLKGISDSIDVHLPCWQALFRDGKEINCPTFAPH